MKSLTLALCATATALFTTPLAADIMIHDGHVRSAMENAKTAAAFFTIHNSSETADTLIGVESDLAARTELHTHIMSGDGIMQMREDEDGFDIPATGMHALERGADHVMFMGLNEALVDGQTVSFRLIFENAGAIDVELPVQIGGGHGEGHGDMKMDAKSAAHKH